MDADDAVDDEMEALAFFGGANGCDVIDSLDFNIHVHRRTDVAGVPLIPSVITITPSNNLFLLCLAFPKMGLI